MTLEMCHKTQWYIILLFPEQVSQLHSTVNQMQPTLFAFHQNKLQCLTNLVTISIFAHRKNTRYCWVCSRWMSAFVILNYL